MDLWDMPGPARYLANVTRDLHEGRCVVLALPKTPPADLREAIRHRVRHGELGTWRDVSLDDRNRTLPLAAMSEAFEVPDDDRWQSVATVADGCSGYIIWIDGLTHESLPAWRDFLSDFNHVIRARPIYHRPLLLVPLSGFDSSALPGADVALEVRPWRGVLGELDLGLYFAARLSESDAPPLRRAMVAALVRELARFDLELAESMLDWPLSSLLSPLEPLNRHASRRGWTAKSCASPLWHDGMLDEIDGERVEHVAASAMRGDRRRVARSIWRAQLTTLFPAIEEQRALFVERFVGVLRAGVRQVLPELAQDDIFELELGQLARLVGKMRYFDYATRDRIRVLLDMRNALAHLEPVSFDMLRRAAELSALPDLGRLS